MKRKLAVALLLTALLAGCGAAIEDTEPPASGETALPARFSEFMSSNGRYAAPNGETRDWIELRNGSGESVDLGGCFLSDSAKKIKFRFPEGSVLSAGEYRVLWCGKDTLGFSLSAAGGETLCLFSPDGTLIDRVKTPALARNVSYALDEAGLWTVTDAPTPGYENTAAGYAVWLAAAGAGDCAVVVNEVMADNRGYIADSTGAFPDWVELYNAGDAPQNLSGFWLGDDPESPLQWRFPDGVMLEPGEYLLVFCDGTDTVENGEYRANFSLSKYGETVTLCAPGGALVDSLTYGELSNDRAALRGGEVSDTPTPGFENSLAGLAAFRAARRTDSPLVINEAMSSNAWVLRQSDGEYYDWVELKNVSDAPVSLADYTLSDDPDDPEPYRLPETELAAGETYLVILNGDAPFALDAREDWLYLRGADGALADYVHVYGTTYKGSIGRRDGADGFFYFSTPSPGKNNTGGERLVAPAPEADTAPGVYNGIERVAVALTGPGELRYTTDGSVPTASSPLCEAPIELTRTTVLRARCFGEGMLPGKTATLSYIINEGHTLPVLSLAADPGEMRRLYNTTAYVDTEIDANLSFFESGGSFSIDCGITLHGASSRWAYTKKSLKANFRPRYAGALEYDVFGDGQITSFGSLNLRGGTMVSYALLRDEICSTVAERVTDRVLALNTRYSILYINGEYWGIYALREAYSEKYAADHLGIGEDEVRISRAPVSRILNPDLYAHIMDVRTYGARTEERYREIAAWLDMDSLADWMILEGYFSNLDVAGNIRYVYSARDGRWRYALFDLDWGLPNAAVSWYNVFDEKNQFGTVPINMVNNPIFRDQLLRRMAELLSGPLTDETVTAVIEEYRAQLTPEIAREEARWRSGRNWENGVNELLSYANADRGAQLIGKLAERLDLTQDELDMYF